MKNYDKDIFKREKKGFELPIKKWMKDDLKPLIYEVLLSESFKSRNLFNQTYVEKLINDHMHKGRDNTYKIWILLCLELWFRNVYE